MWPWPAGDLLYVGGVSAKKLNSLGIYKIGQLANAKIDSLFIVVKKSYKITYSSQRAIAAI